MWTVAYQLKYVDHMDVTVDYYDDRRGSAEEKARKAFANCKEYKDLKFARLEHEGSTVEFFRP